MSLQVVIVLLVLFLSGCSGNSISPSDEVTVRLDFSEGQGGWTAGFADYPVAQEEFFELEADHRPLPPPLDTSNHALFISGNNHSSDLFMFYKVLLSDLSPDTRYQARFELEIATHVPSGCVGIGGSPGESVFVKAGASQVEPEAVVIDGAYRMNLDKGNQAVGGESAVVMGDISNSFSCDQESVPYQLKQLSSSGGGVEVTTGSAGDLWLLMGTDSGFGGKTSLYYRRFVVSFEPL